jgi:hypothetical protein
MVADVGEADVDDGREGGCLEDVKARNLEGFGSGAGGGGEDMRTLLHDAVELSPSPAGDSNEALDEEIE